jgi:restriction system protein
MARRRKDDGLLELVMLLPWWLSVILALLSYFGLSAYLANSSGPTPPLRSGDVAGVFLGTSARMFAELGRFALPVVFLAGALLSFLKSISRRALLDRVAGDEAGRPGQLTPLHGLTWLDFERLIGEAFRRQGYSVTEQGGAGADGGVDLQLRKGGETFLVQCKHWRAQKVSVAVVRELYGAMAAAGASGGFVVTSGAFTADARSFARGRNVELIDGEALQRWFKDIPSPATEPQPLEAPAPQFPGDPACPTCGASMVRRTARRGARAGNSFWGCSRYPACRGVRDVG